MIVRAGIGQWSERARALVLPGRSAAHKRYGQRLSIPDRLFSAGHRGAPDRADHQLPGQLCHPIPGRRAHAHRTSQAIPVAGPPAVLTAPPPGADHRDARLELARRWRWTGNKVRAERSLTTSPAHWQTGPGELFTGMSVSGKHAGGWPADHGHVSGVRLEGLRGTDTGTRSRKGKAKTWLRLLSRQPGRSPQSWRTWTAP
jgi:hypothetical protein